MTPSTRAGLVKSRAKALGFDAVGITDLAPPPHQDALDRWLEDGLAGTMRYMHRQAERRRTPERILPRTSRAIMLARNYFTASKERSGERRGLVARYAQGKDYHTALRGPLDALSEYVESLGGENAVAKWYVDAGPVPERELAQRAGIGWIGKNTMLIDPARGSFFFLAAILTDVDLAVDPPFETDRCGTCRLCLDACPTDAFVQERVLDSRRCISYLTIEHRGDIDRELAPLMGDWVFGCDICQDVCPWNEKFARQATDPDLEQDPDLAQLPLDTLLSMSEREFGEAYGHTALERPGWKGMQRNAKIAMTNAGGDQCHTP